ncbi:MAG: diacylglycerol kinase family lipid kinase [Elusimicrobiaceae bacterium]|nr:diacylglycerol kinase family lipid kinase [Elusimicrobiaceae bacterium]
MENTRYRFIVNPNSGSRTAQCALPELVRELFPAGTGLHYSDARGDARRLAADAVRQGVDVVVAAGGDGTINEVVQSLAHTNTTLGIVALGSGNGLARSLGLSLDCRAAARKILDGAVSVIDLGRANGEYFANIAGIGVDERIGGSFNQSGETGRRGMLKYFVLGAREFLSYAPGEYVVSGDGFSFVIKPYTIAVANGREYGSGAAIAGHADLSDGVLELVCIRHMPLWRVPGAVMRLFSGRLGACDAVCARSVTTLTIKSAGPISYHLDGESRACGPELAIAVEAGALKILC